ncbi:hypothetical protein GUITHDRAFT_152501 [Guillardia theta CCMP2712]|uniref:Uncharacterized protein n=1 Tax=Guillardia theta (strain CCMP2712) TaxID=905079 RepID=L1JD07_GUITC|nr:hypothetical protein GUITHDRAFT_152501 [Guillardia theta CCMP2712]EKX45985.1 hypothetical protein GUITHDRAFT_152501 [Guillardia theta CCMP2712]|eukprot:XP_005832965.1 hypothetical protein GUITHDRAFT_152501 [Guillardia theta CCMP2712]
MDTPCTQLDLATMEGKVVGLGEEEKMKTIAMEMLEARSDYILVLRKVDEEGNKSFTSLCHAPSMADIQITE